MININGFMGKKGEIKAAVTVQKGKKEINLENLHAWVKQSD